MLSKALPSYISFALASEEPCSHLRHHHCTTHRPSASSFGLFSQPFSDRRQLTASSQHLTNPAPSRPRWPYTTMASTNPDDMEEFQRLSDRYQPDLEVCRFYLSLLVPILIPSQGPLVSHRLPIAEVVTEYAHADPTFITKTRVCVYLKLKTLLTRRRR